MLPIKNPVRSLLLFAVLSTSAAALGAGQQQSPGAGAPPEQRQTTPIAQRLALSHDQRLQFRELHKEEKAQREAVQADTSLSPHARRQNLKEIRANTETKIRAMLNQNQLDEYDQIKRAHQEEAARRRDTTPPPRQQ